MPQGGRKELLQGPLYYVLVLLAATVLGWRSSLASYVSICLMAGPDFPSLPLPSSPLLLWPSGGLGFACLVPFVQSPIVSSPSSQWGDPHFPIHMVPFVWCVSCVFRSPVLPDGGLPAIVAKKPKNPYQKANHALFCGTQGRGPRGNLPSLPVNQ